MQSTLNYMHDKTLDHDSGGEKYMCMFLCSYANR